MGKDLIPHEGTPPPVYSLADGVPDTNRLVDQASTTLKRTSSILILKTCYQVSEACFKS